MLEPPAREETCLRSWEPSPAGYFVAGEAPKVAAMASRSPAASRLISSCTSYARRWMAGSALVLSIQAFYGAADLVGDGPVVELGDDVQLGAGDSLSLTARGLIGPWPSPLAAAAEAVRGVGVGLAHVGGSIPRRVRPENSNGHLSKTAFRQRSSGRVPGLNCSIRCIQ